MRFVKVDHDDPKQRKIDKEQEKICKECNDDCSDCSIYLYSELWN